MFHALQHETSLHLKIRYVKFMDVGTAVLRNAKSTVNIFGTVNLILIYVLWVGQTSWQNWSNLPSESVLAEVTSF